MVVLPARFIRCRRCDRLITVDANNLAGRCTAECEAKDELEALSQNRWWEE